MRQTDTGEAVVRVSVGLGLDERRVWTPEHLHAAIAEAEASTGNDIDWRRYEIVDGALVVSPAARPSHALLAASISRALHDRVSPDFAAIEAIGIRIGRSYRVTDVTVLSRSAFVSDEVAVDPSAVLLAVEIESPSSVSMDRIMKPAEYAGARIPHYWRLETDPLALHAYRLHGDVYAPAGSWRADEVAHIAEPFVVDIDLALLIA